MADYIDTLKASASHIQMTAVLYVIDNIHRYESAHIIYILCMGKGTKRETKHACHKNSFDGCLHIRNHKNLRYLLKYREMLSLWFFVIQIGVHSNSFPATNFAIIVRQRQIIWKIF